MAAAAAAPDSSAPTPRSANDRPDPGPSGQPITAPVLYFAYGANMDPAVLARRGVTPAFARPAVLVSPPSLRLAFAHRAAFATLVDSRDGGEPATTTSPPPHGVLYGLDAAGWKALERAEVGYRWTEVGVQAYEAPPSSPTTARAFVSSPLHRLKGGRSLPPPAAYLGRLVSGARAARLDEVYCAWLERTACADPPAGRGLPGVYFETPGRDAVLLGGLGLAAGMVGWAISGSVM